MSGIWLYLLRNVPSDEIEYSRIYLTLTENRK